MKKHIKINSYTLGLVLGLVGILYLVRFFAAKWLVALKDSIPELMQMQQELLSSNLTAQINGTIVEQTTKYTYYSLGLYFVLLPLGIYFLILIFEGSAWKELLNISWKRIALLSIINFVCLAIFSLAFLDIISLLFFGIGYLSIWMFVIISLVVAIIIYFNLIAFIKKYDLRNVLVYGLNKLNKIWYWYLLFLICIFIVFLFILLLHVSVETGSSLLIVGLLTLLFVILMNMLRIKLFKVLS